MLNRFKSVGKKKPFSKIGTRPNVAKAFHVSFKIELELKLSKVWTEDRTNE